MHLKHNPDGTFTVVFAGREVFTGVKQTAERLGRELEWGERCPVCLTRADCSVDPHCQPRPEDRRRQTDERSTQD
jgi:hypothetical protein